MKSSDTWNYFHADTAYADVLAHRLREGVQMDSAIGLGNALQAKLSGDLSVLDFGSGPGHYLPVLRGIYDRGTISYRGVDIVESNVEVGNAYFAGEPDVSFAVGSVLSPAESYQAENCILSANTLPHIPTIEPLMTFMRETPGVEAFAFRMLIGQECVEIRKHLSETYFDQLFEAGYQHNNIYSLAYLQHLLGPRWSIETLDDQVDLSRLERHSVPAQQQDPFYRNRVSRAVGELCFKGDIYMPWKLVIGRRVS